MFKEVKQVNDDTEAWVFQSMIGTFQLIFLSYCVEKKFWYADNRKSILAVIINYTT
jgi:hypothetical protein